jgi:hypothetical protein
LILSARGATLPKDWPEYCSFETSGASGKSAGIKEQIADLAGKGVFQ